MVNCLNPVALNFESLTREILERDGEPAQQVYREFIGETYAWLVDNEWKNERFAESGTVSLDTLCIEYAHLLNHGRPVPNL